MSRAPVEYSRACFSNFRVDSMVLRVGKTLDYISVGVPDLHCIRGKLELRMSDQEIETLFKDVQNEN